MKNAFPRSPGSSLNRGSTVTWSSYQFALGHVQSCEMVRLGKDSLLNLSLFIAIQK